MKLESRVEGRAGAWALIAFCLLAGVAAVGCKKSSSNNPDGGDGTLGDVHQNTDTQPGDGRDTAEVKPCVAGTKAKGDACGCNAECTSGFCADGVCCNVACTEGCKTCNATGNVGTCTMRSSGDAPRDATTCATTPVAMCGLDGKCDGNGGCRKYPANTMCKPGTCDGDAVVGSYACDGDGHCKLGSTRICVPFSCNPSTGGCYDACTTSSQCVSGQACMMGSCGKLMKGASCRENAQCASGFCADGVCCNVACQGACVSCNLPQLEGTCWPIDADKADPRGVCHDQGASTCGQTGKCDGLGGCSKYPRDQVCIAPTCSGNRLNTAGTCNGLGTCQPQGIQECKPFRCVSGACTKACMTNSDCDTGIACMNMTCGLKLDGQMCTASAECQHGHCVDGVCCDQACTGACRSCALAATMGRCTPAAAGATDPRAMCAPLAQETCGTNGKCDGNGGCATWPVGTLCAAESCNPTGNVYKAPSTCNTSGQCVAPDPIPCSPFMCNGSRCFNACTTSSQCVPPNSCASNSCGLKDNGASCSAGAECKSKNCAQGVCCDTACNSACKSCIAGQLGVCSNVANGAMDPSGLCTVQDPSTCGTNGKCEGGACQRYPANTTCSAASCPTDTNVLKPLATCDGAGTCVMPATQQCFPYRCGSGACKATCTTDADCLSPAVCSGGFCGLKPTGAVCSSKDECVSGFCEQGICCAGACTGLCKSCALSNSKGTCSNVPNGTVDVMSRCADQGAMTCHQDGFCDGKGACRLYGAGTACAAPSCPTNQSNLTSGRTCDGLGACQAATTINCAPYVCNGTTACRSVCSSDGDCLSPNICDPKTSRCGNQHRLGQSCTANADCLTGNFCVDGVCCSTSSCGLCQSCNIGTSAGNCANIPAGTPDTANRCMASPPCGNTGACNGAGACQQAGTSVSCGTQSCTGSTSTPVSHCNGTGGCITATTFSCTPYVCGTNACKTSCTVDGDCLAPYTCQGTAPKSCALKTNGQSCSAGNQCISGNCIDTVCCGSSACTTCQTCNGTTPGTCTALAAGTPAPAGQCPASPPCGNTGACNGASGCQQAGTSTACGLAQSCTGTTYQPPSVCNGSGSCSQAGTSGCGAYVCGTNACKTSCAGDTDCASGNYCASAVCTAKKGNGAACGGDNQCTSAHCLDGVCCGTATCPTCQTCNGATPGTCANVGNGVADPGSCAANGVCGNNGLCNGSGGCQQQPASVSCGLAQSCSGGVYQPPSVCSGTGTCNQTGTSGCGAYLCGGNACKTSCAADTDCASGNYCAGAVCTAKKGNGVACAGDNQCTSAHCTDGVCCGTATCLTCQTCNGATPGTCANVGNGVADPGSCAANGVCGNNGLCNGSGGCQQQPASVSCGLPQSCGGGVYQPPSVCSGTGTCNQTATSGCGAYVCGGAACRTSCGGDGDCANGYYCVGTSCVAQGGPGASCGADRECASDHCLDGVCCNVASCGACRTCNGTTPGTCSVVADGQADLHNFCPTNPPCGNTGFCKSGACALTNAGTMCSGFFCVDGSNFQPGGTCTGSGGCTIPGPQDCFPYACATGGCLGTCGNNTQCVSTHYCSGSACVVKKTSGTPCSNDGECGTNHCTEGVCCDVGACTTQCQSCAVSGFEGQCHNVGAGAVDPTHTCSDQGAPSCGTNGRCTAGGACALYDMSTVCNTTCLDPTFTTTFCDGIGGCTQLSPQLCPSLTCNASGCL